MNIIMLINSFYPLTGGAEKQAQRLSEKLTIRGINVTVITRHHKGLPKEEYINGVKIIRLNTLCNNKLKKFKAIVFALKTIYYILTHLQEVDIIHAHQLSTGYIAAILRKIFKIPAISKIAGGNEKYGSEVRIISNKALGNIRMSFLRNSLTAFIAISKRIYQDLVSYGVSKENIFFSPNGVDTDIFINISKEEKIRLRKRLNIPIEKKVFLYAGRFEKVKGIDILLNAWIKVEKEIRDNSVLVALGEGSLYNDMRNKAREYSDVLLPGNVNNVKEYLQMSDFFVLPSRYEGLSNALLEAMSCKIPVIATNVGGNIDVIQDDINGILVKAENEEQLAEKINFLYKNDKQAIKLGTNARVTVINKYSLNKITDVYIEMYEQLNKGKFRLIKQQKKS